jgi:hypothetical protein
LWVVGAFGVIAVLVFQYANELADLNAYGRRYLTKGRPPRRTVTLFEREPRDVVLRQGRFAEPPRAPQETSKRPPPPPVEVPSPRTAAPGKPPSPSLEEYGWVAWPPPNPPPAGRSDSANDDTGKTSKSVKSASTSFKSPPKPTDVDERTKSESDQGGFPGSDGWDAKGGWPSASSEKETGQEDSTNNQEDVSKGSQAKDISTDNTKEEWQAPPDWDGWVAWPPPNPPPSQARTQT